MIVKRISRNECAPFVLGIHYARRWPSITHAFGLFDGSEIIGVVTYGTPPSATLRRGVAGDINAKFVLELNRLCLKYNRKNEASFLVSRSLKMLPNPSLVVSFADTEQGHLGVVYQACNFTYHGLSAKRTDWKVKGMEHKHGQTIADEFRGVKNRAQAMRDKYGDDFYLAPRPRKHRYIFISGSKTEKKNLLRDIKYKQEPYPKRQLWTDTDEARMDVIGQNGGDGEHYTGRTTQTNNTRYDVGDDNGGRGDDN